jgi:hypothetical protein
MARYQTGSIDVVMLESSNAISGDQRSYHRLCADVLRVYDE